MANEKTKTDKMQAYTEPKPIGDTRKFALSSPHDLTEDVDPEYAGEYELVHGTIRVPMRDEAGVLLPTSRVFKKGQRFELSAIDAHRMLQLKVVKRVDGKRPDSAEPLKSPLERALPTPAA